MKEGGGDVNMLFHAHTGLPLQYSPVSTRKGQGGGGMKEEGGGCQHAVPCTHRPTITI